MIIHNEILRCHFKKLGFDDEFFKNYEVCATDRMQNFDAMISHLRMAYTEQQKIVIYTDFDVDGIMSGIIAYAGLSELGFKVDLFKPNPAKGYGFHTSDVDAIIAEFPDVSVIFTGDVGISCNDTIDYAKSKNLKVLVTDHHISRRVCTADIAVNPNQLGEKYSHNNICGSYVIYQILHDYCAEYHDATKLSDIYRLQMFAGIATISDVMPLIYENRQLVRNSVSLMKYFYNYQLTNNTIAPPVYSNNYSQAFVGMKKLLEYFCTKNKIKTADDITEQFFGFYLVPFLNSGKRMNGDMNGIYDIFFSSAVDALPDYPDMSCVANAIKYVDYLNEQRKILTDNFFAKLLNEKETGISDSPYAAYMNCEVYVTDAPCGLCGLLAQKFIGMSNMPTLVVMKNEDGSFVGSGRNPSWFDFAGQVKKAGLCMSVDGHKEAFGVSFVDDTALAMYATFFNDIIIPEQAEAVAQQKIAVDATISITNSYDVHCDFMADVELIRNYLAELATYHPFGKAFPEPKFAFYISNDMAITMFGQTKQHIKLVTASGIEVMLFNQALDFTKLEYDNRDKPGVFVCYGSFRNDTFDNKEFDTISFFVDSVDILRLGTV